MLFSSITFLYYFLPVFLILYFVFPRRARNLVILLSSLFFYAFGEPKYILLMLVTFLCGYILGILAERYRNSKSGKLIVIAGTLFGIGILAFYKYTDFVIQNINNITGMSIPFLNIALPIGISFYTFQMLSYVIDVSRGQVLAQRNFIKLATYISMFPQLIAGPIVRYKDISKQLDERDISISKISLGIRRFVIGLSKKVIVANTLGELVSIYKDTNDKTFLLVWIYAIAVALQIYFDFSGYSDMAIGLGKIIGFDFPENFDYPYISRSVTEFWRRWHITLGAWFRDYLYIPLGGNRVSILRWIINIFIVWMATGLWHGASWNFVIWGMYFAVLLILEKKYLKNMLERWKIVNHIYLFFMIIISFVIFDSDIFSDGMANIKRMFGIIKVPLSSAKTIFLLKDYCIVIIIAFFGAVGLPSKIIEGIGSNKKCEIIISMFEPVYIGMLLIVSTAFLVNGSFNPFLYFRF